MKSNYFQKLKQPRLEVVPKIKKKTTSKILRASEFGGALLTESRTKLLCEGSQKNPGCKYGPRSSNTCDKNENLHLEKLPKTKTRRTKLFFCGQISWLYVNHWGILCFWRKKSDRSYTQMILRSTQCIVSFSFGCLIKCLVTRYFTKLPKSVNKCFWIVVQNKSWPVPDL